MKAKKNNYGGILKSGNEEGRKISRNFTRNEKLERAGRDS